MRPARSRCAASTRVQALRRTRAAAPTPFVAQLIGAEDEPIATAPVVRLPAQGSGCGCHGGAGPGRWPFVFEAMLPDVAPGTELRILKRAEEDRACRDDLDARALRRAGRASRASR